MKDRRQQAAQAVDLEEVLINELPGEEAEPWNHTHAPGADAALDGRDAKLLQWVTDSGLVALIADNYAVELLPQSFAPGDCAMLPLHQHCLFTTGVNLGELFQLSELADWLRANNRSRFLFTGPPLRLPGAVGSPATPVATV